MKAAMIVELKLNIWYQPSENSERELSKDRKKMGNIKAQLRPDTMDLFFCKTVKCSTFPLFYTLDLVR